MIFYGIFVVEMALKLIGLGVREYCRERFNIFDFGVVLISTVEVGIFYSGAASDSSSAGTMSAFRGFRLLRVLKLLRSWTSLRRLLETIYNTIAEISHFCVIMLLFGLIYTLLGMELFAHRLKFDSDHMPDRHGESPRQNFDDFFHAFISIFAILVGDDW
jgi:hypothetical protein